MTVINKYKYKEQKKTSNQEDVYIGRGSMWGNPFVIGIDGTRDEVIEKYATDLKRKLRENRITLQELADLKDKDLICFCAPQKCHGDILSIAAIWAWNKINNQNS